MSTVERYHYENVKDKLKRKKEKSDDKKLQ